LRATIEVASSYTSGDSQIHHYFLGSGTMRGFEPGGISSRCCVDDALGGNTFAVVRLEAELR
jgi:outer membrane protein insertion porin family